MNSNLSSKNGQEGLLEELDSNPYGLDSNLNFKKFAQTVGFESQVKKKMSQSHGFKSSIEGFDSPWELSSTSEEGKEVGFEFPTQRFEFRNLEMWRTHERFESSKDGFESHLQNEAENWRSNWLIRIPFWCTSQILQRKFKSSSYGLESPFCKSIWCLIRTANYSEFQRISLS